MPVVESVPHGATGNKTVDKVTPLVPIISWFGLVNAKCHNDRVRRVAGKLSIGVKHSMSIGEREQADLLAYSFLDVCAPPLRVENGLESAHIAAVLIVCVVDIMFLKFTMQQQPVCNQVSLMSRMGKGRPKDIRFGDFGLVWRIENELENVIPSIHPLSMGRVRRCDL